MSSEDCITAEFDTLLADAIDHRLDDAQLARFTQLLAEPEAVDYYVDHAILHAMLQWEHVLPLDEAIASPLPELLPPPFIASPAQDNASSLPSVLSSAFHGTIGFFSQEIPFSLLIATVITALGLLAGSLVYVTHHQRLAHDASQSSGVLPNRTTAPLDLKYVGRVTDMADVRWADINTSTERGNGVPLGRKYALASGLMEITYDTGAKVILQGPVTYAVDSRDGGFLSVGKLTARLEKKRSGVRGQGSEEVASGQQAVASGQWPVASETNLPSPASGRGVGGEGDRQSEKVASGQWPVASESDPKSPIPNPQSPVPNPSFAVRTPTATVTDLGTEFGVEVNEAGETDTQVFVGSVQVASTGAPDHRHSVQTKTLLAGQYARVGKDQIISTDDRDFQKRGARFARTMPKPLSLGDEYAKLVLSMKPVVYYRMDQWPAAEGKNRYVLVDSAPGGRHGVACLDPAFGKPSSAGKFGGALDLHGSMGNDYAFVKNYPKAENGQISVSAWVYAITLDPWAGIVLNWFASAPPARTIGQFGFGLNNNLELGSQIRQQDGTDVTLCELGVPLPRSQWQHVAFVADGAILHLYRNGREVAAAPCGGIPRPLLPECLSIGCEMDKNGTRPRPSNAFVWNGRLDEIAVFNHALTAEQVRQLYSKQAIAK